jgi:hypothetical protein
MKDKRKEKINKQSGIQASSVQPCPAFVGLAALAKPKSRKIINFLYLINFFIH